MATETISWVDWFFGTNGLFGFYKPKQKEDTGKTLINGIDTGLRLKLNQLSSIKIDGITYDIKLKESTTLDLAKRDE